MPTVLPLRGLRYDPKHVGALSQVLAPPYDAIDDALRATLYERHPANAVRLEFNRGEPGDDDRSNAATRAARFLRAWREQGVLMQEPAAAVYACRQAFEAEGRRFVRHGMIARVRLERFGTGNIHPHEETRPGPRADRVGLLRACRANLSPVFGLYPDPHGEVQAALDAAVAGQPPVEATDPLGVRYSMWPVADEAVAARVAGLLGPRPLLVADGHHRYEAACVHRDAVAAEWTAEHGEPLPPDHPANFALMMLSSTGDPGLVSLPVHRMFELPVGGTAADLCARLGACFTTRTSWKGPAAGEAVWANIELEEDQGTIGLYTGGDQAWTLARITAAGRARLVEVAGDHGDAWRGLGVTILQRLIVEELLGVREAPPPACAHRIGDVVEGLGTGRCSLAALVMPVGVEQLCGVCETGDRLPPGSTCFHPPIASGLVFSPLD